MTAKRITITITAEDKLWLEGYSQVRQISAAAAIRQGICLLKKNERQETYRRLVESTRGIWETGDGLPYQEKMRREWK